MKSTSVPLRHVAWIVLVAILVIMGVNYAAGILDRLGQVIGWVFVSIFLAVALGPPVEFLVRLKLKRWMAILTVYLGIVLAVFGIGLLIVPPVVSQVNQLADDLPGYIDDIAERSKQFREFDERYQITEKLEEQAANLPSHLGDAVGTLSNATVGALQRIFAVVTILVLTFFLLRDGWVHTERMLDMLPRERAERIRGVCQQIYQAVAGYVTGNLVISVIAGIVTYVTLSLLGVPFAIPLAILMAFLDLIPMVGATLGAVTIGIVAAFVNFPTAVIVWAIVIIVYQQIENNVVQPVIYRRAVELHPLVVIIAILIGGTLYGVLGALMAIPVAASIRIIIKDWWAHREPASVEPGASAGSEAGS